MLVFLVVETGKAEDASRIGGRWIAAKPPGQPSQQLFGLVLWDIFDPPNSFVEIDARQKKIRPGSWQDEYDRPIYFVELRDSYVCSWCEIDAGRLMLVPCPHSRGQIRQVRYPGDADIIGRVTAVTMRIAASENEPAK